MEEDEDGIFRRPPVTEDLKQILDKYPDGGQILKVTELFCIELLLETFSLHCFFLLQETVQNAEDAGASEIFFSLDERKFGRGSVFNLTKGAGDGGDGLARMQARQL